jgi:putative ABC transport system ATP-binding protein
MTEIGGPPSPRLGAPRATWATERTEPAVQLRDVFCVHRTRQGDAAPLQGLSLSVAPGERMCVLGPSSAGKTTMLRVVAGLARRAPRTVRIRDGRVVQDGDSLVVSPGGWVRLGDERLRGAGIGEHLQARPTGDGLLLTPAGTEPARPVPVAETIRARGSFSPANLDVRSVSRVVGGRTVLDELTVSFAAGLMTAVMGRSGAGKTTLLELLAGLADPDAGEVLLDGQALGSGGERLAALRHARIGYLPQEPVPVGFLSATENVALALHARGYARVAAARDARTALTAVGLAERRDQRVDRLSAGEAQRVALARALASARGLLIVDEPTSRLDEETAAAVADLLVAAAEGGGHTVICATHDSSC